MSDGGALILAQHPLLNQAVSEDAQRVLVSLDGAEQVTENVYTAQSASFAVGSPANTTFTIYPPSATTILDRKIYLQAKVLLTGQANTVTTAATAVPVPVPYPLNSAIDTLNVKVNGTNLIFQPRYWMRIWERMYPQTKHQQHNTTVPVQWDNDINLAAVQARAGPFSTAAVSSANIDSRFQWAQNNTVSTNGTAGAPPTWTYTFTEPLMIDLFEMFDEEGIYNIQTLEISINWATDAFSRMFSSVSSAVNTIQYADNAAANQNALCNFVQSSQTLQLRYLTPSTSVMPRLRDVFTMPYQTVLRRIQTAGNVPNGSLNVPVLANTIITPVIPRYIVVCVRNDPTQTAQLVNGNTNYFCQINSFTLAVGNNPANFVNASPQQLYEMCVRNGYNGSWREWYTGGQGFIIVEIGKDVGGLVPGTVSPITFQPRLTFSNLCGAALSQCLLEVFFVTDGFITLASNQATSVEGLAPMVIEEAKEAVPEHVEWSPDHPERAGKGFGSVFRKVRDVFGHIAGPAADIASKIPGLQPLSTGIKVAQAINNAAGGGVHHRLVGAIGGEEGGREHRHRRHHSRSGGATHLMA